MLHTTERQPRKPFDTFKRNLNPFLVVAEWEIRRGQKSQTYGPYMQRMVEFGRERVASGELKPFQTERALGKAGKLFRLADKDYRKGEHPLTGDALKTHQENVLNGNIILVPEESATTVANGIAQVERADKNLRNPRLQETVAAINYGAFFKGQTMASATRTLDQQEVDSLIGTAESTQEAMPHLTVSNWAIGETVSGVYEAVAKNPTGRLRVIDIGSGPGATIAAISSSINSTQVDRRPDLALTALEATPEFFTELADFAQKDSGIAALGLQATSLPGEISTFGSLNTLQGDAAHMLQDADVKRGVTSDDITVITANYSWHRLNSDVKKALMREFRDVPNTIFIIGDLAQNGSVVNRRYFNIGANGPVNCGNRELTEKFQQQGYTVVNLDKEQPQSLDPRLAKRIAYEDKNNDGHLWIAYYGDKAEQALNLVSST